MIVKDERDTFNDNVDVDYDHVKNDISNVEVFHDTPPDFVTYLRYAYKNNSSTTSSRFGGAYLKMLWSQQ